MTATSSQNASRLLKVFLLPLLVAPLSNLVTMQAAAAQSAQASQNQSGTRKPKLNPPPEYPELARKLNIQGMARVLLTVAADGRVTSVKELGGNPVLVGALAQAVKKWKYEPADRDSEVEVKFEFVQNAQNH
jgi:TonB family protein